MDYRLLLILALFSASASADLSIDPLQDPDQDFGNNVQDKRTICAVLNNCGGRAAGSYVKRVVVKPSLVGYRPVVRPVVVKPTLLGGYKYTKPSIHFGLKAPGGWKPINTAVKPVVEVVKPENHVDVIHNNPVPHVDHVHVKPGHVHLHPGLVGAHVDQVHQISVPHGGHYDTFAHVHPVAQPLRPFAPSPVLFEVTRPNLGVLPLGSRFLTPVLKGIPHAHHHLHAIAPAPIPVAPAVHPPAVPVAAAPVIPAQPAFSIEYHGTRNYLPLAGALPALPHHHHLIAPHQHLVPQQQPLPLEHAAHGFVQEQALPHEHQHQFVSQDQYQQQLPHQYQQQLPHQYQQQLPHQYQQQQLQAIQQYQDIPQGQLPLEGDQEGFGFEQSSVIQPGQTDLQIPYHLPQHGAWQGQEVFRPSQQLETPYHK